MNRVDLPTSIDPTGAQDATDTLTDFLNTQPADTQVVFPHAGRFKCEGIVRLVDRVDFSIAGNRSTIFAETDGSGITPPSGYGHLWPRKRIHVHIAGGSNVSIDSLFVVGAHPNPGVNGDYVAALEAQHGFEISGASGVSLSDCRASRVYGDFVYVGVSGTTWSENVLVEDFIGRSNGRQGCSVTAGRDVKLRRSWFDDVRRSMIDLEPSVASGGAQNVDILDNYFGTNRLSWIASLGQGANVGEIRVFCNTLAGCIPLVICGIEGVRRGRIQIHHNRARQEYGSTTPRAFTFTNIDGVSVYMNRIPLQAGRDMKLAGIRNCSGDSIRGNEFPGGVAEWYKF